MSSDADGLVGRTLLGRLKVIRRLGAGGMGAVYEVEHLITHHRRALKVLHSQHATSAEATSRLVREAGVAGKVQSEVIAETFDVGQLDDGSTYILMELLEGATIGELIERDGRFDPAAATRIARRACEGLAEAHEAGFVHRDIKPDNLFLEDADPGAARVKILDFGIATMLPGHADRFDALTKTGTTPGTPLYMAPEQMVEGAPLDGRADLYAVGLVLYEMLAGRRPFEATTLVGLVSQVQRGEYVPLSKAAPGIDPGLEAVVHRAMHKDAGQRFADARAMAEALRAFEDGPPREGPNATPAPPEETDPPARAAGFAKTVPWNAATAPPRGAAVSGPSSGAGEASPVATPPPAKRGAPLAFVIGGVILALAAVGVVATIAVSGSSDGDVASSDEPPLGEVDEALEESIADLARRGRSAECLERALEAPASARILRLRLSCARSADDWDAYREACALQTERHPDAPATRNCAHNLELHESGVQ